MSSKCSSDFLDIGRKNNKLIIIVLIFVLFCFCGGGSQGGSCYPVDNCCRRRRRRPGIGVAGTSLLPILVVLALVLGTGNRGGNTNIVKVNTDPSGVRGTDYSYCDC